MRFLCTRFLCTIVFASIYLPTVHPRELTPRNPPIRKEPDQDPAAVHSNDYPLTDESSSEKNPKLLCTSSPFRFCIPGLGLHRAKIPKKPLFVCDDERKNKIMKFLNARPERYFTPENEVTLRVCLSEGFNDSTVDALMLSSAQATLRTLRKVSGVADAVEGMTRSELDGAIKQLWESIKGNESLLDDFVIMPNEHAIRYVVGAREAIGLLLASQGMSILFERTDSDKTQRLLEPLSKLLERPMFKLHSIAQWYTTQLPSGNLWLPDPLYRPKNSKGLKFLWGTIGNASVGPIRTYAPDALASRIPFGTEQTLVNAVLVQFVRESGSDVRILRSLSQEWRVQRGGSIPNPVEPHRKL